MVFHNKPSRSGVNLSMLFHMRALSKPFDVYIPLCRPTKLVETVEMSSNMVISRCPVDLLTVPHPRNLSFLLYDEIDLSQRIVVQMTSELVRLKAVDEYFSKINHFWTMPQSPLLSDTIEDGCC